MAVQIREKLTITADGFRSHGEYFRVRKARSLPRFLTATPIVEMKPRRVNKEKRNMTKRKDEKRDRRKRKSSEK